MYTDYGLPQLDELDRTSDVSKADERQDGRLLLRRPASLLNSGGLRAACHMVDISPSGCQLTFDVPTPVQEGKVYCIKLEGMELLGAFAIWSRDKCAGFLFVSRLHPAIVEHAARVIPSEVAAAQATGAMLKSFPTSAVGRLRMI